MRYFYFSYQEPRPFFFAVQVFPSNYFASIDKTLRFFALHGIQLIFSSIKSCVKKTGLILLKDNVGLSFELRGHC